MRAVTPDLSEGFLKNTCNKAVPFGFTIGAHDNQNSQGGKKLFLKQENVHRKLLGKIGMPKTKGNHATGKSQKKFRRKTSLSNGRSTISRRRKKSTGGVSPRSDSSGISVNQDDAGALASDKVNMAAVYSREASFEDNKSDLFDDDEDTRGFLHPNESDEDTEDASETDMAKLEEEFTEMKEQMYQEKLRDYKNQLHLLNIGKHEEYSKRLKELEKIRDERLLITEICKKYEFDLIESEHVKEKWSIQQEYEQKKIDLKETLLSELQDKKRTIEAERVSMELTGDSVEIKPAVTRKLRRRPNDPLPAPEKRRKTSPQINYLLDDDAILDDLRALNKLLPTRESTSSPALSQGKGNSRVKGGSGSNSNHSDCSHSDARLDDGKLYCDKKWFSKGSSLVVENRDGVKYSGTLSSVGQNEIVIKKTDNTKTKIYLTSLQKGKFILRKKNNVS